MLRLRYTQFNSSGEATGSAVSYEVATPGAERDLSAFLVSETHKWLREGIVITEASLLRVNSDAPALTVFVDLAVSE